MVWRIWARSRGGPGRGCARRVARTHCRASVPGRYVQPSRPRWPGRRGRRWPSTPRRARQRVGSGVSVCRRRCPAAHRARSGGQSGYRAGWPARAARPSGRRARGLFTRTRHARLRPRSSATAAEQHPAFAALTESTRGDRPAPCPSAGRNDHHEHWFTFVRAAGDVLYLAAAILTLAAAFAKRSDGRSKASRHPAVAKSGGRGRSLSGPRKGPSTGSRRAIRPNQSVRLSPG